MVQGNGNTGVDFIQGLYGEFHLFLFGHIGLSLGRKITNKIQDPRRMDRLEVGDRVPDFSALDQDGNTVRLKDYRGRKLVVFFFPRASTPGCTAQVCNLRDHYGELRKQGYELLGVSADSQRRQTNFRKKNNLDFPLVADEDHTVINTFGVWAPKKFMGRTFNGIHRTTFVIDKDGVVERVIDKVKTKDHAAQVLEPQ